MKKGSGAWPLLTFWYAIALDELGIEEEAREVFERQVEILENKYISEQIFENKEKSSIRPLAWSHANFVIAADRLGYR